MVSTERILPLASAVGNSGSRLAFKRMKLRLAGRRARCLPRVEGVVSRLRRIVGRRTGNVSAETAPGDHQSDDDVDDDDCIEYIRCEEVEVHSLFDSRRIL